MIVVTAPTGNIGHHVLADLLEPGNEVRVVRNAGKLDPSVRERVEVVERGVTPSCQDGYVAMMRAKNDGMDNAAQRAPGVRVPTTYRQRCEAELKPAMAG